MSHIVQIQTQVKDAAAVRAACQRLNLPAPVQGKVELFSGEVEGLAVQLPDWVYPVVVDLPTGEIKVDDFGGRWGDRKHLDKLLPSVCLREGEDRGPKARPSMYRADPRGRLDQVDHPSGRCRMSKSIEITVSPKGETSVQTKGFAGSSCRDASRFIEQALGQRTGEQLTAEFHQTAARRTVSSSSVHSKGSQCHRSVCGIGAVSPMIRRPADWDNFD